MDELKDKDLKAFDLIKCYSSCMYNPSYDWIRTDYNDTWEDYDDELKLGLYYVIVDSNIPIRFSFIFISSSNID